MSNFVGCLVMTVGNEQSSLLIGLPLNWAAEAQDGDDAVGSRLRHSIDLSY